MAMSKDPVKRARQLANLEKGKFKKGQVANPLGAGAHKKSPLAAFLHECEDIRGMMMPTPAEVAKMYFFIASLTEERLKELLQDKKQPMMMRIIARGVLDKKGIDILEKIVNRAYGSQQRLDITTNGKELQREPLTIKFVADKNALAKVQEEVSDMDAENKEEIE